MAETERRLFGMPDAEELHLSIDDAVEHALDWYGLGDKQPDSVEIVEWTVQDSRYLFPDTERVLEFIDETACDNAALEGYSEAMHQVLEGSVGAKARRLITEAIDGLADAVTFWIADQKVATHVVDLTPYYAEEHHARN